MLRRFFPSMASVLAIATGCAADITDLDVAKSSPRAASDLVVAVTVIYAGQSSAANVHSWKTWFSRDELYTQWPPAERLPACLAADRFCETQPFSPIAGAAVQALPSTARWGECPQGDFGIVVQFGGDLAPQSSQLFSGTRYDLPSCNEALRRCTNWQSENENGSRRCLAAVSIASMIEDVPILPAASP